jgi:YegS/Rv2252/BmrU family lipid kinase
MNYVFIMNPFADRKRISATEKAIIELKQVKGDAVYVEKTEYSGHAGELALEYADRFGEDVIVFACGGDGTVHEISNALVFRNTPMAVIPMGTGNDFARSVLSKEDYNEPHLLISRIDKYEIRSIDVIRIESFDLSGNPLPKWSKFSINISSFGLDTMVQSTAKNIIKKARRAKLIRRNAYSLAVLVCMVRGWDFKMKYSFALADKPETAEGELAYCLAGICNGQYYGNGFHPAPQAKLDDGILDVCLVEDIPLRKAIPLIAKYKNGTHIPNPNIRTFRVTGGVIFSTDDKKMLQGNYEGEDFWGSQVRFEVVPSAVRFAFFSI